MEVACPRLSGVSISDFRPARSASCRLTQYSAPARKWSSRSAASVSPPQRGFVGEAQAQVGGQYVLPEAALVLDRGAADILDGKPEAQTRGHGDQQTGVEAEAARVHRRCAVEAGPLADVASRHADRAVADVAPPLDVVAVPVGEAEAVLARLESESTLDVVETAVEPVGPEGVALGEGQHVRQVGFAQAQTEAVGVGESDLLALQGGDSRGVPVDRGGVAGRGDEGAAHGNGAHSDVGLPGCRPVQGGAQQAESRGRGSQPL